MSNEINNITSIEEAESMIAVEEEKKQAIYLDLGKQYFVRHSSDCDPELKPLVDELVACSGKIAELDQRILALKGPTCPNCGMPVNEDSIFCCSCGTRLKGEEPAVDQPAEASDTVICPQCGSEMKNDMRFCTACGTPLIAQEPVVEDIPQPEPEAPIAEPIVEEQPPYYAPEEAPAQDPYYADEPAAEQDPYYADEPVAEQDPYYAAAPVAEDPYYAPEPVAEQDPYYAAEPAVDQESFEAAQPAVPRAYVAPEPSNICPVCGAVSASGIGYCVNCGNPLEDSPAPQPDYGVRRCPNCGFISSDPGMSFCTECGTPLN